MRNIIATVLALVLLSLFVIVMVSCKLIPQDIEPVSDFDIEKYLGNWYEIARLDFKHERNLSNVKTTYAWNDDGKTIRVENTGFDYVKNESKRSIGKAKFKGDAAIGALKVSFFGPFYSGYNVVAVDPEYKYALVMGDTLKYLWILSRTPEIPEDIRSEYLNIADSVGYNIEKLTWTNQSE